MKSTSLKQKVLGSLEQKIITVLWQVNGSLKPCEVQEKLSDKYAYTTVMTVLSRMAEKGLLKRSLDGHVYRYTPSISRKEFVETNVAKLYSEIVREYGDLAIAEFIEIVRKDPQNMHLLKECFCEGCPHNSGCSSD